jgi:acyl-CoA reductase-like NAD-dependent aldehyde dehydrogenase
MRPRPLKIVLMRDSTNRSSVNVTVPHANEVLVAGQWVEPVRGAVHQVVSPSTEEVLCTVALAGAAEAQAAVDAGRDAVSGAWGHTAPGERIAVCARLCELLEARLDEFVFLWAHEAGMPVRYAKTLHRFGAVDAWRTALASADEALRDEHRESPLGDVVVTREPAGVVLGILPYNGPLASFATKVVPALLAGCAVVVKPAVETSLLMRAVADCAASAGFPAGAISILPSGVDVARQLSCDPGIDLVSLTGGPAAAEDVVQSTVPRFARTILELGGKSPALVLDDAPIDQMLRSLIPGATSGTGQVCAALSRILVPEKRREEIVDAIADGFRALRIGDPLDPETAVGPLVSRAARERTEGFVARAREDGAIVVAGGRRPPGFERGWYYEPTLLAHVNCDSELAQREVFGPATAVITYSNLTEAIRIANGTPYGLAATIYTADEERGRAVAREIEAGSVAINTFGPTLTAPYGGRRGSGWGRECGPEGIREFTEIKQVLIAPKRS